MPPAAAFLFAVLASHVLNDIAGGFEAALFRADLDPVGLVVLVRASIPDYTFSVNSDNLVRSVFIRASPNLPCDFCRFAFGDQVDRLARMKIPTTCPVSKRQLPQKLVVWVTSFRLGHSPVWAVHCMRCTSQTAYKGMGLGSRRGLM